MSILGALRSLLGRHSAHSEPEATLDVFAMVPVVSMIQAREPFDSWCPDDVDVPESLRETFKGSVHLYQMYIFWILAARRFGYDIAERMSSIQAERVSRVSTGLAAELNAAIRAIHNMVAGEANEDAVIEVGGRKLAIPLEYKLALWFLTVPEGSPYHVSPEAYARGEMPDFSDNDVLLGRCLEHGRTAAFRVFQPIVETTKVTL